VRKKKEKLPLNLSSSETAGELHKTRISAQERRGEEIREARKLGGKNTGKKKGLGGSVIFGRHRKNTREKRETGGRRGRR